MCTAYNHSMDGDEALLRRAETTLAEIDRNQGLSDEQAEVLAAIRIRIYGAPRKSLDDVLRAAVAAQQATQPDPADETAPERSHAAE